MKRDKKEEEDGGNPFANMEKSSVLQEARTFNETPVNPRRCSHILTKILYLINQGEHIGTTEATEAFFAMTKLFQSKDVPLRRMVYLGIKEMAAIAEDVIIVTSSLTRDMTGREDQFRGPAIRALCRITDSTMLQSIERYMKQAIVDKNAAVSSAALVSSLHLGRQSGEVVKRWVNEAQEAVNSDNIMVQYHALGLLYHIRKSDKLAVTKLVSKFGKHSLKSPYAYCLLIRIASKLIDEEGSGTESPMFDFIESCLRHKSEMVIFEAAQAIIYMRDASAKDLAPAVSVLQLFLSSPKPTLRFAGVKALNKVAMKHPAAVTACNLDLESMISDVNRSIATLAITTLLKTGSESSIDRLMKQISSFMNDISDEFKTVVIDSIKSLCEKFPRKHGSLMSFLANMLRDEGGFEYKKSIVETLVTIVNTNDDAKEAGLGHLCEFIEDCEHTVLATKILHLLGREGPRTPKPSKYIRYIYNRLILENAAVRAAAVSALAKFGAHCDELMESVLILLQRAFLDTDDEVRDRATFYYNILQAKDKVMKTAFILNGLQVSVVGLERALHDYTLEPSEEPFSLRSVPTVTQPIQEQKVKATPVTGGSGAKDDGKVEKAGASWQDIYMQQLAAVPELAPLGPLFKSSNLPVELTEAETEYGVRCVKHTYAHHIVLQFDCTNTLNDQLLENATVVVENNDGFEVLRSIPAAKLEYDKPGTTYTLLALPEEPGEVTGTLSCTLKFTVKDVDPSSGDVDEEGYPDEYVLEDLEISVSDHVQKVMRPNFAASWDEVGPDNEVEDTFALTSMKSLEEAVKSIVSFIGMQPCDRSDKVPDGKSSHTLVLAGVFRGGHDVLVRARLALAEGVTMQLTVRSSDAQVSQIIAANIG